MNIRSRTESRQAVTIVLLAWLMVSATWIVLSGGWNRGIWWHWLFAAAALVTTMEPLLATTAARFRPRVRELRQVAVHTAPVGWRRAALDPFQLKPRRS